MEEMPRLRDLEGRGSSSAPLDSQAMGEVQSFTEKRYAGRDVESDGRDAMKYDRIKGLMSWRRTLILIGLNLGLFLSLMDTSIMATAIYSMALEFNTLGNTFWAILAYQLAYLGFAGIFARVSDFIGRRVAVMLAFAFFIAFSLGAGWAKSINQLIIFRTLQGVGGAGLYSLALILMIEVCTERLVPLISAFFGATIAVSGILGPILGGVFTHYVTWRWIFWVNGPCGLVAALCFLLGWPNTAKAYYERRSWKEFDYVGAVLILACSILIVFGIQEAGQGAYSWNSPIVLATIISGAATWPLLAFWSYFVTHRNAQHGSQGNGEIAAMVPLTVLTHRPLVAGIISTMLTGFTYFLVIISLPLRFQIVNEQSPSAAGVRLLPLLCSAGFGSFIGGAVSRNRRLVVPAFIMAASLILLGSGLMSTLNTSQHIEVKCYGFQIILGFGVGLTFATISIMTSTHALERDHTAAQGIVAQVRVFGGSIGVAASNAVFNAQCKTSLQGILTPEQIASLQSNTRILESLDGVALEAVRVAYANSFTQSLRICTYVAAACLAVSLFTWTRRSPTQEHGVSN